MRTFLPILLLLGGCSAAHPACPALEPADLALADVSRDAGGCDEPAPGGLRHCFNASSIERSELACTVDGWACQAVEMADGTMLSRVDIAGPVTLAADGSRVVSMDVTGWRSNGTVACTGTWTASVAP